MPRALPLSAAALAATLALAGCGASSASSSAATAAAASSTSTSVAPTPSDSDPASSGATSTTSGSTRKVNANEANEDEIAAALSAAGVPNADRWAREVAEYRPYPSDDPTWAKLRKELAKYNPADGVVDQIISVLEA